jgi:hypothetical protein
MAMRKLARIVGIAVIFLLSVTAAIYGQGRGRGPARWERLGSARVNGNMDHDRIPVGVQDGMFRMIQLRVRGGAVEFMRVVVHYADGAPEEVVVRERVPDGGTTRPIDLQGNRRYIRSVELWYGRAGWRRQPEVQLYGMR